MSWVELRWDIAGSDVEILSGELFALGALGVLRLLKSSQNEWFEMD